MPPRVYADTSVIGGVFDSNFAIDSTWIFEEVAQGSLILLVSNVLEAEVSEAPESVRQVLGDLPASAVESVLLDARAKGLRDAYLAAKVVGPKSARRHARGDRDDRPRRRTPLLGPSSYRGIGEGTRVQSSEPKLWVSGGDHCHADALPGRPKTNALNKPRSTPWPSSEKFRRSCSKPRKG